jgi:hypothetical protein
MKIQVFFLNLGSLTEDMNSQYGAGVGTGTFNSSVLKSYRDISLQKFG